VKFSDIEKEQWAELQPYMDTCLLPVTGLTGNEQPWEATHKLEILRDAMEFIEVPYKGRVVTYPAVQYVNGQAAWRQIDEICSNLKSSGYSYVIVMTASAAVSEASLAVPDLFLYVSPEELTASPDEARGRIRAQVQALWAEKQ
jgi:23S rRNA (pseudouridine1915-N3)-methyltransferase